MSIGVALLFSRFGASSESLLNSPPLPVVATTSDEAQLKLATNDLSGVSSCGVLQTSEETTASQLQLEDFSHFFESPGPNITSEGTPLELEAKKKMAGLALRVQETEDQVIKGSEKKPGEKLCAKTFRGQCVTGKTQ